MRSKWGEENELKWTTTTATSTPIPCFHKSFDSRIALFNECSLFPMYWHSIDGLDRLRTLTNQWGLTSVGVGNHYVDYVHWAWAKFLATRINENVFCFCRWRCVDANKTANATTAIRSCHWFHYIHFAYASVDKTLRIFGIDLRANARNAKNKISEWWC